MVQVYVALGANLGDRAATLGAAVEELRALAVDGEVVCSSLHETEPVGGPPQPDFLNAVAGFRTALEAPALLTALQRIEARHGRARTVPHGPRTLDLDLLWYDGQELRLPGLEVPHPRMGERLFVLAPLAELAPELPLADTTVAGRLACLGPVSVD
ncbi:MAG: 2-amino-4-hydroxy-6-hydroxymethyldihydropteridine diphosphokinase [Planctomycetota bacterium]